MKTIVFAILILNFYASSFAQSNKFETVSQCTLDTMKERNLTGNQMFDLVKQECERLLSNKSKNKKDFFNSLNTLYLNKNSKIWFEKKLDDFKLQNWIKNNLNENKLYFYGVTKDRSPNGLGYIYSNEGWYKAGYLKDKDIVEYGCFENNGIVMYGKLKKININNLGGLYTKNSFEVGFYKNSKMNNGIRFYNDKFYPYFKGDIITFNDLKYTDKLWYLNASETKKGLVYFLTRNKIKDFIGFYIGNRNSSNFRSGEGISIGFFSSTYIDVGEYKDNYFTKGTRFIFDKNNSVCEVGEFRNKKDNYKIVVEDGNWRKNIKNMFPHQIKIGYQHVLCDGNCKYHIFEIEYPLTVWENDNIDFINK